MGAFDDFKKGPAQPAAAPQPTPQPTQQPTGGAFSDFKQPTATPQTDGAQTAPTQPAQPDDWSTVALNEAAMYSLPSLRAQAAAARQRLGPVAAASADVAGNFGSPTTALNFVPYVGPELAGGVHEGVKSYMSQPDWWPGLQGWEQIGKDTAGGVAGGLVGHGAGAALTSPELFKYGAGALGTAIAHKFPAYFPGQELLGATGAYKAAGKVADWTAEKMATPAAQAAIRSLVQGGTAAMRASSPGPLWDQWVPGQ